MKNSHFGHELRAALRETRLFLPIPSLALLLGVAISHSLWLSHTGNPTGGGFTETQRQARVLLDSIWPYVAWLAPYAIFKFPDLKNPAAFWRTTPVSARTVFGTRILLAVVFTVLLPALLFGGALHLVYPEIAADQTLVALRNQWIWFAYGAFAALVARDHRGILLVLLMGLTWQVTDRVVSDFYLSVIIGEHRPGSMYFNGWVSLIPGDFFGFIFPVLLAVLVRRSAKTFRFWPWIAATGGLVALTFIIPDEWRWKLFSTRVVRTEKKERPIARAVFSRLSPEDSRKEVLREKAIHGPRLDPKLSYFARAMLVPETGDFSPDVGGDPGRGNILAFTSWSLTDKNFPWVSYEGGLTATLPDAEKPGRRAVLRDYSGLPPYDREDKARARLAAITGDPELQALTRGEKSGAPRTWVRLADLKHDNTVVFYLSEPEKRKAGVALNKNRVPEIPPRLFANLRLVRYGMPKVILRCPASEGGSVLTSSELVSVAPMVMERGYALASVNTVRRQSLLSPVFPGMFSRRTYSQHYHGEYQVALYNRKRHQAVTAFMSSITGTDYGQSDEGSVRHMINMAAVREVAPLIDKEWMKNAELVVYSDNNDNDAGDDLPIEFTAADTVPTNR